MSNSSRALSKYGNPTTQKAKKLIVPTLLLLHNGVKNGPTTVQFHKEFAVKLSSDLWSVQLALNEWIDEVQTYNVRPIAGTDTWSMHSWGLAADIFAVRENTSVRDPKTGRWTMSEAFAERMEARGWRWGGRWKTPDPHHYEVVV